MTLLFASKCIYFPNLASKDGYAAVFSYMYMHIYASVLHGHSIKISSLMSLDAFEPGATFYVDWIGWLRNSMAIILD